MKHASPSYRRRRNGSILILGIIVCLTLAATVLVVCRSMRVEMMTSANLAAASQASEIERGGEQYLVGILTEEGQNVRELSEDQYAGIQVGDGYFWVLRPNYDDSDLPAFGLTEESAKVNINYASQDQLMLLPGMTDDIAGAIIDWRDEDNDPAPSGAESDAYLSTGSGSEPYYCKNAPFETVEEMLLLRGMTRELLYGDGTAPPLGQRSSSIMSSSSGFMTDPQLARGWYDLLTIYSQEPNRTASGQNRINLRDRNARNQLRDRLRQLLDSRRADEIVATLGRSRPSDIFDFAQRVNLSPDELDKVADDLTTTSDNTLHGKINILTAPRDVLLCLDGIDSSDVDKLIGARPSQDTFGASDTTAQISWIWTALGQKAIGLGTQITTRTYQYSADILAVSGNGRAFKRCRIVFDTRSGTPTVVYRRDITDRGWPMDKQVLASIRAGNGPGSLASGVSGLNGASSGNNSRGGI